MAQEDGTAAPQVLTARIRRLSARVQDLGKKLPLGHRLHDGLEHGLITTVAAVLAYLPTQFLGLQEGFWAAFTAIGVVQTELTATRDTARDQFIGAAIGGAIGVGVNLLNGQNLASFMLAIVLAFVASFLLNVASAARLAGITATIILLVPHEGTAEAMMVSRVVEVGWGVGVAIAVVWLASKLDPRPKL